MQACNFRTKKAGAQGLGAQGLQGQCGLQKETASGRTGTLSHLQQHLCLPLPKEEMECLQVLKDIARMDVRGCAEPSTVLTEQSDRPESRATKPCVYGVLKTQSSLGRFPCALYCR